MCMLRLLNMIHWVMLQVVHVVLANAFKYTRKGSVTMEADTTQDDKHVIFRVSFTQGAP